MYNLLLVDDEPLIKVAFQSAVEWGKNGFLLAATASNGQEALHIVETQHIDAVITDLKMPGMDGLALIHELKKRSFIGPILVLSNYSDFDSVRAALTDGAYDYVGLNREYLSRLFSKETGIGLFQYINEVRMKRAGEMIRSNKQVYIKEVAAAVGFDDPYFFSRKFKDFYGKTPSEYAEG